MGKRALPPLPTCPQLVAVYPALFECICPIYWYTSTKVEFLLLSVRPTDMLHFEFRTPLHWTAFHLFSSNWCAFSSSDIQLSHPPLILTRLIQNFIGDIYRHCPSRNCLSTSPDFCREWVTTPLSVPSVHLGLSPEFFPAISQDNPKASFGSQIRWGCDDLFHHWKLRRNAIGYTWVYRNECENEWMWIQIWMVNWLFLNKKE